MLKDDPDRVKRIREKAGKKISNTILSNDAERKRRAKVLASLNKTEDFRRRTSETATQTSTRPEIIAQRSKQLAVWRENNPELCKEIIIKLQEGGKKWRKDHPQEFYDKCIKPMLNSWKSKPETVLFNFCKDIDDGFNNTSFVKHSSFTTKTNSRQIDIFHSHKNIIVEFDGPLHFDDIFGEEDFAMKQQRDRQLNALSDVYCIIRVSYEHYNRKRECFDSDILDNIRQIIISPKVGLYLFGELYGKN